MPLVLSLLDQVYALRRQMNALTGAIREQPEDVRQRDPGSSGRAPPPGGSLG